MRIENLKRLINGELITKPAINSVGGFAFALKNLRPTWAFIALDASEDDVRLAVEMGAYAIIFDSKFEVLNEEIAYIHTPNLNSALFRLMRFEATLKKLKFALFDSVTSQIARFVNGNFKLLHTDTKAIFTQIMSATTGELFLSDDYRIIEKISSIYTRIDSDFEANCINPSSIFYSNFRTKTNYFDSINFPRIFVGEMVGFLEFLEKNSIKFRLNDMRNFTHFEPVFVDKFFKICNFGASYRAFICESDLALFERGAEFLRGEFSGGIVVCAPKGTTSRVRIDFLFKNIKELKKLPNFHYAIVLCPKKELVEMLGEKCVEQALF